MGSDEVGGERKGEIRSISDFPSRRPESSNSKNCALYTRIKIKVKTAYLGIFYFLKILCYAYVKSVVR